MTTIVNTPAPENDAGGTNFLIGIILLIGFVMMTIFFGIPLIKKFQPIQVNLPSAQIVVPDKINVTITQQK